MRTVSDLYKEYRIPSWLQLHQLRVAAVGRLLAKNTPDVEENDIILCGLFHDMANILKIDLGPGGNLTVAVAEDMRESLRQIQNEYRAKYGNDEHAAAIAIGREIGLPNAVLTMIDNMRFMRSEWVLQEGSPDMQIAKYSDLRVAPYGIVSMQERFEEARRRYEKRGYDTDAKEPDALQNRMNAACYQLESLVCRRAGLSPEDLTDEAAAAEVEKLRQFPV